MIRFLVPLATLPVKTRGLFDGMVKGLIWCLTLPDSVVGTGIAVLLLLGAFTLRHLRRPTVTCQANIGDFSALLYVGLQFVTLPTSESYPNTIHFITPSVVALCAYFSLRLLPLPEAAQVLLYRIAVFFGLLLALADLVAWVTEVQILASFPRSDLAALHANLPLIGGPTQNDSIMLVLAILPFALASWMLARGRNRWFSFLSQMVAAALIAVIALSFSRGIYLSFAVLVAGTFVLMKQNGALSPRLLGSACLIVGVPVIAVLASFDVLPAAMETVGNKTISEQRSTMGRIVTWRDSLHEIEEHPLLGTGGYSDGLESLAWLRDSPDKTFTARTYNAPLEALLSSGLIGLLSYGTFLTYPIIRFFRGSGMASGGVRQKQVFSFLAAGIIALIVRDLTYSSLVLDGRTILIAWITVALLQNFIAIPRSEIAGANDQAA